MFKLVKDRTAWWPVRWKGVTEDGEVVEHEVELKFKVPGREEFTEQIRLWNGDREDSPEADRDFARAILDEDWRGVGDKAGKPLPFTWERFFQLLDWPNFAPALGEAYFNLYQAAPELRPKNSAPSPADGPAGEKAETTAPSRKSSAKAGSRKSKSGGSSPDRGPGRARTARSK